MTIIELDIETFSSSIDWKQFEGLAELAFKSFGYHTVKNYRIKRPRAEIDLIAFSSKKVAFAVDCKHWKRTVGHTTMLKVAEKQIKRCESILEDQKRFECLVPIILTWHDEQLLVLENGVPIVPIQKISDFILNWNDTSNGIKSISKYHYVQDEKSKRRV